MAEKDKILVIDDEDVIRNLIQDALSDAELEVVTAATGKEGLDIIKAGGISLVMTDIKLPDISGVDILEEAKRIDPDTQVIMITGYASVSTSVESLRKGAYDYLAKPFEDLDIMIEVVKKALDRRRLEQENRQLTHNMEIINKELKKGASKSRKKLAEFSTLNKTLRVINASSELDEILKLATETLTLVFEVDSCLIMLTGDDDILTVKKSKGVSKATETNFKLNKDSLILKQVSSGQSALVSNFADDQAFQDGFAGEDKKKVDNFFVVPLIAQGKMIGVVTILKLGEGYTFDEETQDIFSVVASQIAAPIRLCQK